MEIVERDDGFMMAFDARYLIEPFRKWDNPLERKAMRFVRGRVLDVGCGGGRVCLYLQDRGLDVVGIDSSPGAITCCQRRGVRDARVLPLANIDTLDGLFDTVVMLGQNLGMVGSSAAARRILRSLARCTTRRGRIVAETWDPLQSNDDGDRRYRERNRTRGRMPGQLRVRIRYGALKTRWMDWLQMSPDELAELLDDTGWTVSRTLGKGPSYIAVIDKRRGR